MKIFLLILCRLELCNEESLISWPPDHNVVMNVAGFQETYDNSIFITLCRETKLEVKMASLAGLFLLKILAWKDRGSTFKKDAIDMAIIIENYGVPVNTDRLYELEGDLLEEEGYDLNLAGARILGRDVALIAGQDLSLDVQRLLDENLSIEGDQKLIIHMSNTTIDGDFEKQFELIRKVRHGMSEIVR